MFFPKLALLLVTLTTVSPAAEWTVPLAGNTFRSEPAPGNAINPRGNLSWSDPGEIYSIYLYLDRPATLRLALRGGASAPSSWVVYANDEAYEITVERGLSKVRPFGTITVESAGYLEIRITGSKKTGNDYGEISDLIIQSKNEDLKLHFVESNQGNMFYWGRRGPSVHLKYEVPKNKQIEWGYSEITVPKGQDPIGSYFMANGFGQGYFGFQVKSPTERWVLFSVWSPFSTNNPGEVPEKDRVATLAKGKKVRAQKFGGEGSGGQSFLKYPWKAGKTYRFLTRVQPNGDTTTTYTSWFGDKEADE